MADPVQPPPQKSSFGCLKILAILAGVIALVLVVIVVLVWQTISWVKNAPETTMATYPPLQLSAGEKEDVDRIITKLWAAQPNKAIVDEYVSPEVFNGVMEKIIEEERKKSANKSDQPAYVRGGFNGPDMELKITTPFTDASTKQTQYVNVDIIFDCEIEDGKFKQLEVKQLLVHDAPPPFIARSYINMITKALQQGNMQQVNAQNGQKNPLEGLEVIKQLKREGNKVHFVIDGSKMKAKTTTTNTTNTTETQATPDEKPASGKKTKPAKSNDDADKPKAQPEDDNEENNEKTGEKEK